MAAINEPARRGDAIRRITWTGLWINLALSAGKMLAGWFGHSQAVLADGVHSLSDTVTDVAVLVGVRYWNAPADEGHPHGHQRIETMVSASIGLVLAAVAVGLGWQGMRSLAVRHETLPGTVALVAAIASIILKEGLYRYTVRAGRRLKSQAVIANAWHHRSDALSSIPATIAVASAMIVPSWYFLDHLGAIVVCIFILQAAWKITWPAMRELADAGAPAEVIGEIERVARETDRVRDVHKVRTRHLGAGLQVDLHVLVDGEQTVRQGHEIGGHVRRRLGEMDTDIVDVIVHVEPYDGD